MKAVVYYSLSNRTKQIIESIEADKFRIEPKGKVPKSLVMQMIVLGFFGMLKKSKPIQNVKIDLSKYEEIVLATPVWAGGMSCFMRAFLESHDLSGKRVTLIATCDGGAGKVMEDYKKYLNDNEVDEQLYIKGERV